MAEDPTDLGGVEPRKKSSFTTYLIVGVIAVAVIGGVMLFTGGNGDKPGNGNTNPSTPVVTIPQLKNSIDGLTATVSGFSGRLANLESQMAGLVAPTVTKAEFNSLQTSVNGLSDSIANWSSSSASGSLDYWLTEDSDDDVYLHILSAKDIRFVAEVTISYDDPSTFENTTYDMALAAFYDDVGTDRDYLPTFIPYHTVSTTTDYNISIDLTETNYDLTDIDGWYNLTIPITTTLSDWEYSTIIFHTGSFKVDANEDFSGRIDYLPEDYDTISVRLLPSLETSESDGSGGI